MSTFQVECGSCGKSLEAGHDMAGLRVRCPHCRGVIRLPSRAALGLPLEGEEEIGDDEATAFFDPSAHEEDRDEETTVLLGEGRKKDGPEAREDRASDDEEDGGFGAAMAEARKRTGGGDPPRKRTTTRKRSRGGTTLKPRGKTTARPRGETERRSKGGTTVRKRGDTEKRLRESPGPAGSRRGSKLPLLAGVGVAALIGLIAAALFFGNRGGTGEDDGREGKAGNTAAEREAPEAGGKKESPPEAQKEEVERLLKYVFPAELEEYALEMDIPEALIKANGKRVPRSRFEELRAMEKAYRDEVTAEVTRRRDDPFYDAVQQVKSSFLTRKGLDNFKFRVKRSKPYVVFEHVGGQEADLNKEDPEAERNLEQKLRMLKHAFRVVKKRWMDPFGLTRNPKIPLILVALKNRKGFDALSKKLGMELPPGVLGYFMPTMGYIVIYNGAVPGKSLQARSESNGTIYHEGVHQIVNAFVNKGKGVMSTDYVPVPWWVSEGLAEYVGSVRILDEKDGEGYERHAICIPNPGRLVEFWRARHLPKRTGIPPFHLELTDMVACFSRQDIIDRVKRKVGDRLKADAADSPRWQFVQAACVSMMYAEASSFFLFCYEYEGGKYAESMNRFLERTYEGYTQTEEFKKAFGVDDLRGLNAEWFGYVESVTPGWIKKRLPRPPESKKD